jgi:hypothetical protein
MKRVILCGGWELCRCMPIGVPNAVTALKRSRASAPSRSLCVRCARECSSVRSPRRACTSRALAGMSTTTPPRGARPLPNRVLQPRRPRPRHPLLRRKALPPVHRHRLPLLPLRQPANAGDRFSRRFELPWRGSKGSRRTSIAPSPGWGSFEGLFGLASLS